MEHVCAAAGFFPHPPIMLPEIGGPDILAADPRQPEEIAGAVLRLENEDALYRQQREYGLLRARQFSWKKTADELIQVYQSLDIINDLRP